MNNLPSQFWPVSIIVVGATLALAGYVISGSDIAQHDLFTLASSLVSGGLGAFINSTRTPPPPSPTNPQ